MPNSRTWLNNLGILSVIVITCGCTTVYESPSGQKYIDASDKLVDQLAANLSANLKHRKPRVAVWSMTEANGKTSPMSITLHEAIKTSLSTSKHFELVEDEMMEKVQESLRKQEKAEDVLKPESVIAFSTNAKKMQQLAELLAAQAIIVGSISESGSEYLVFIRLIPLTNGVAGSGARVTIPKRVVYHERPNPISNILNAVATSLAEPSNGAGGNNNGGAGFTTAGGGGNYNYTTQGGGIVNVAPQPTYHGGYTIPAQAPGNNYGGGRNVTSQGGGNYNYTTQGGGTVNTMQAPGNNNAGGRNVITYQRQTVQPTSKTVPYYPTTVPYYPTVIPAKRKVETVPRY